MENKTLNLDQRGEVIRRVSFELGTLDVTTISDIAYKRLYVDLLEGKELVSSKKEEFLSIKIKPGLRIMDSIKQKVKRLPVIGAAIMKIYHKLFRS